MNKVLSLIVPTYNMEKYLQKCLSSVIVDNKELLDYLEVLVINDGSKDTSSEIAHTFETRYPGVFRVLDKENGNYGSCINAGLPLATGKYVKILDADDYFDQEQFSEYLNKLLNIDVDLVISRKISVDPNGEIIKKWTADLPQETVLDFDDICDNIQVLDMHKMAYRRTLLLEINYRQSERVSYSDIEWTVMPLSMVSKAIYLPLDVYQYLQGRAGQTVEKSVRSKGLKSLRVIQLSLGDYYKNFHGPEKRKKFLFNKLVFNVLFIYREFFMLGYYDKDEFRKLDAELMSRYPEIQPSIDNHKWVSFIPNLQLVRDWREKKSIKYALEMGLIKSYLFLSKLKPSSNS